MTMEYSTAFFRRHLQDEEPQATCDCGCDEQVTLTELKAHRRTSNPITQRRLQLEVDETLPLPTQEPRTEPSADAVYDKARRDLRERQAFQERARASVEAMRDLLARTGN
jgi:hypothetical protein